MKTVDRGIARVIAIKRMLTGSISLAAALFCLMFAAANWAYLSTQTKGLTAAAFLLFLGGGAWSLRDGVRGWKML